MMKKLITLFSITLFTITGIPCSSAEQGSSLERLTQASDTFDWRLLWSPDSTESASVSNLAQTQALSDYLKPGPFAVGFKVAYQYDYSRTYRSKRDLLGKAQENARPMQIAIWYPAQKAEKPNYLSYRDYVRLNATLENFEATDKSDLEAAERAYMTPLIQQGAHAERVTHFLTQRTSAIGDAESKAGSFPLVLYIPGGNGTAVENALLHEYLASHGYVIATIPSYMNRVLTRGEVGWDMAGIELESEDLEFVINFMGRFPNASVKDMATLAWSWGGLADILLSIRNHNVKAVISLDGGIGFKNVHGGVDKNQKLDASKMKAAFLHFVSQNLWQGDRFNQAFHDKLNYCDSFILRFQDFQHGDFAANSILKNYDMADEADPEEMSRKHAGFGVVAQYTLRFLNAYVKDREEDKAFFRKHGVTDNKFFDFAARKAQESPPPEAEIIGLFKVYPTDKALAVYKDLRQKFSLHDPLFSESSMNALGYSFLYRNEVQEAIAVLKLVVDAYPNSANACDSLGEAYLKSGKKELAIQNYERSLKLNPKNANAAKKLKELKGQ